MDRRPKILLAGGSRPCPLRPIVGASPFEGNYGPSHRVPGITEGLASGRLKYAVMDPRFSKTAAKAWKWLPIKPGTEAAAAMAVIHWIIDNGRYNAVYLANANKAAAKADGEASWCNATWLVKIENGEPGKTTPLLFSPPRLAQSGEPKTAGANREYAKRCRCLTACRIVGIIVGRHTAADARPRGRPAGRWVGWQILQQPP